MKKHLIYCLIGLKKIHLEINELIFSCFQCKIWNDK